MPEQTPDETLKSPPMTEEQEQEEERIGRKRILDRYRESQGLSRQRPPKD